jgi:anti-sigma regulatory factor (Ser/Thr protein kinase)
VAAAGPGRVFTLRVAAEPAMLTVLRSRLGEWLQGLCWPDEERCALVHAVNEAGTNVIEHAGGSRRADEIELTARVHDDGLRRHVVLAVQDQGQWKASEPPSLRACGLVLMRALTHRVEVHPGRDGTRVTMVSCAVPQSR